MSAPTPERLLHVLRPVVEGSGLDLEHVDLSPAGRRRLLRVVVDKDGGVSLDDVAEVSQKVAATLDETEEMGGSPYVLEVTSPGVDRPLTEPRHWRRASGRMVRVVLSDGTTVVGRVSVSDDSVATLDVEGVRREVPLADVKRAKVEVEFKHAAREEPADGSAQHDLDDSAQDELDDAGEEATSWTST